MTWIAVPRYRIYPMWYVTLTCGHSGPLDPWTATLGDKAAYGCPWCPGLQKVTRSIRLHPTWKPG